MKRNTGCPKCHSNDVEGFFHQNNAGRLYLGVLSLGIRMKAYVCLDCGYVEHWIEDEIQLERLRGKLKKASVEDSVPVVMNHPEATPSMDSEALDCLQCGTEIPEGNTECGSCGWSYK